jgi:hypothetical protein
MAYRNEIPYGAFWNPPFDWSREAVMAFAR